MRATLSVSALRRVLAIATMAVERLSTIPILEYVRLSVSNGKLTATGTNLDVWTSAEAPLASSADGEICVSARIAKLINVLPNFDTITLAVQDERLCIETPDGRASLIVLPAADFPEANSGAPFETIDWTAADLRKALERIRFCTSSEETRYYLCGVYFRPSGRDLRLAATDGHRLAEGTHVLQSDVKEFGAIVPAETVAKVCKARSSGAVKIEFLTKSGDRPDYVRFAYDDFAILSKLIDGKYPDYARVIPAKSDATVEVDRASWLAALNRVLVTAAPSFLPTRLVEAGRGRFSLTTRSADLGDLVVAVKGKKIAGAVPFDLHCNAGYLASMLAQHHDATVRLEFVNANSPLLMTSDGFRTVLMPVQATFSAVQLPDYAEAA